MNVTLIYADTDEFERIVKPLAELAEHGLTNDFAVVASDGECLAFGQREGRHGSVESYLGEFKLEFVRLVRVSFGSTVHDDQVASINRLSDVLRSNGIRLIVGSVAVLATGSTTSTSSMQPFWNFNIVLTPEDGVRESQFIEQALVSPEQQRMIAIGAVALIGRLWRWLEEGPFDDAEPAGMGNQQRVSIGRLVTRLVDAADMAERAIAWAMTPTGLGPPPDGFVHHGDNDAAVAELVDRLAPTRGASPLGFAYSPIAIAATPAPDALGPWTAIKTFCRLMVEELLPMARSKAMEWWTRAQLRVEDAVQRRTFGADSDIVVRLRRLDHIDRARIGEERAQALDALPRLELDRPESMPRTWELLTATVLSCADGGTIPADAGEVRPVFRGRNAVISDLTAVAHAELANPANRGFELSSGDLALLELDGPATGGAIGQIDAHMTAEMLSRLPRPEPAGPKGPPPSTNLPTAQPGPAATAATAQAGTPDPRIALASRLRAWAGQRQRTLLWRLADRLVAAQNHALDDVESTQAELDELNAQISKAGTELATSRRRFRRRALLLTLVLVALVALAVVGFAVLSFLASVIILAIVAIALVPTVIAIMKLAAERVRLNHRLLTYATRPDALVERRQHAASEYARLSSLYEQFQDWAPIVASAMHRPWGLSKPSSVEPWTADTAVLSFVAGTPQFSQTRMSRSAVGVAQRMRTAGWLGRAYSARRLRWLDDYNDLTAQVAQSAQTPEADSSTRQEPLVQLDANERFATTTVYSARVQFRRDFLSGAYADEYRSDQTARLRDLVHEDNPEELIERVHSPIAGLDNDGCGRTVAEFLRPVVESVDVPSLSTFLSPWVVDDASVRSIRGISSAVQSTIPAVHKRLNVNGAEGRLVFAAFRLDVTKPLLPSETRLVVESAPERTTGETLDPGEDIG